jgi:hypothetical protein
LGTTRTCPSQSYAAPPRSFDILLFCESPNSALLSSHFCESPNSALLSSHWHGLSSLFRFPISVLILRSLLIADAAPLARSHIRLSHPCSLFGLHSLPSVVFSIEILDKPTLSATPNTFHPPLLLSIQRKPSTPLFPLILLLSFSVLFRFYFCPDSSLLFARECCILRTVSCPALTSTFVRFLMSNSHVHVFSSSFVLCHRPLSVSKSSTSPLCLPNGTLPTNHL